MKPGKSSRLTRDELIRECDRLRTRLEESEQTLHAITSGVVDAIMVGNSLYKLESASDASQRFRDTVLDQIHESVIAVDNDSRIVYMNPAAEQLYGVKAADVLGAPLESVYHPRWPNPQDERARAVGLRRTGKWRGEKIHVKSTGGELYVEYSVSQLMGLGDKPAGQLMVIRDASEKKRAEDSARAADRAKDEFLATLAHELRNPLAPMRSALEIMRRAPSRDDRDEARMMVARQLDQMVRLVDDLLDVSRITLGRVDLRRQRVDVAAVIQTAVETSRPVIEAAAHELVIALPPSPITVDADPVRLAQVLVNLLNNAAKYNPAGGRIFLTVAPDAGNVVISIRDTGIGIPGEMLSNVFDLFTQIDRALNRAQGGLGIGLTLVKRLVEMHGGTVEARSAGEGQGSEFIVRLPRVNAAAPVSAVRPAIAPGAERIATGCRILVVDDNRDANRSLATLLRMNGHETESAYDGPEALGTVESFLPDAVMLDIGLPGLDGYEVAKRLRETPVGGKLVLIALTGWGAEEDRRRSQEAGFNHHLVKPAHLDDIEALLAPLRRPILHAESTVS